MFNIGYSGYGNQTYQMTLTHRMEDTAIGRVTEYFSIGYSKMVYPMKNPVDQRIENVLPERVASIPVTIALIVTFWIFYLMQVAVRQYYGADLAMALFYIRYDYLGYVWTWVTATFSHVSVMHLAINSYFAFYLGGWVERTVGKRRYLGVFIVGGAITAVGGTILFGNVSGHLLADLGLITGSQFHSTGIMGAAGSSKGWFTVFGMMLAIDPTEQIYVAGFRPRRWVVFVIAFVLSVAGILLNVWIFAPTIGHSYHLVGLVVGGMYGLVLSDVTIGSIRR